MNEAFQNGDDSHPVGSEPVRLIVWECHGSWARYLRRELGPEGPRVFETRAAGACREMLAESPASFVVVEWTARSSALAIDLMVRVGREFPATRMVAVADPAAEPFRWQILETGVVWLCTSPRELGPVVEIIRRHSDQAPKPVRSPQHRIWADLPWADAAR